MPSAISPKQALEPSNYDNAVDDFLRDLPLSPSAGNPSTTHLPASNADLDAEIKIRKPRRPAPKLNDALLLSAAGIPKLRSHARKQLRFKGKGHEFSDIARLLGVYQLWLDDLYPKAKLRDAVGMVEKVGHGKRMVMERRGWMDGTRAGRGEELERGAGAGGDGDVMMSGGLDGLPGRGGDGSGDELFGERKQASTGGEHDVERWGEGDMPEDDELDALMAETSAPARKPEHAPLPRRAPFERDDGPDDDELDALLAEHDVPAPKPTAQSPKRPFFEQDEDDEDELDALMAEHAAPAPKPTAQQPRRTFFEQDEDAEDELDALMSEHASPVS